MGRIQFEGYVRVLSAYSGKASGGAQVDVIY